VENQMVFEILGFDVLLDKNCKPFILEVNHSPSFKTDTGLDYKLKKELIMTTMYLLNINGWWKSMYLYKQEQKNQNWIRTG